MSAIFGVFNLDGAPAERDLLDRMSASLSSWVTDRDGVAMLGAAALGHRMFHTTPESLHETQPHRDETGALCLTMDGRVDNRAELRSFLQAKGAVLREDTDAELVLRAYEVWGEECPARILGDFAFALWDARRRRLFLARDFLGVKPLYYAFCGTRFVFASALHPVLLAPGFRRRANEGMVAEYLSCNPASSSETLFQHLLRLPPAHQMTVTAGDPSPPVRYWSADNIPERKERTDSDYEARFQEVFTAAVQSRMRSQVPVGAELSGGLDSSSIVTLLRSLPSEAHAPPVDTFSLAFPGLPCDETEFIQAVLSKSGARGNLFRQSDLYPVKFAEQARRYFDVPNCPVTTAYFPLWDRARDKGIRVLLSGTGGDDWFTGSSMVYADLLKGMHLLLLSQYLRLDARTQTVPQSYRRLYATGIRPLLPEGLLQVLRRWRRRGAPPYPWISDDLSARSRLTERLASPSAGSGSMGFARGEIRDMVLYAGRVHGLEMTGRCLSEYGLEHRFPFNDRRVVEFALSLPEGQRRAPGLTKNVLRRAMKGLLPGSVAVRRTKADLSHLYAQALDALGGPAAFENLAIEDLGWIRGPVVRRMVQELLDSYRSGNDRYHSIAWPVWRVLAVELWFRYSLLNPEARGSQPPIDSQEEPDHVASRR